MGKNSDNMTSTKKVIFIHGNDTMRWSYGWAPWLKKELDKLHVVNIFETFPDSIIARRKYWLPFLKDKLRADKNTILIGHSSGAVAAMRFAEGIILFGSILISPSYTDLGDDLEKQSGYFDDPWQWNKIKKNQSFIALFYSNDDPYIPQRQFKYIANKLNPEVFSFKKRGHFINKRFPELLEFVKNKLVLNLS